MLRDLLILKCDVVLREIEEEGSLGGDVAAAPSWCYFFFFATFLATFFFAAFFVAM